jgi:nucleoside phosphorylase/tetratricopeptide (TPR) repeat protein
MLDKEANLARIRTYTHKIGCNLPTSEDIRACLNLDDDRSLLSSNMSQLMRDDEFKEIDRLLTEYSTKALSRLDLLKLIIDIFTCLFQADDLDRAANLFYMETNYLVKESLHQQLNIWGQWEELALISRRFLKFLDNRLARRGLNKHEVKKIQSLQLDCSNNLGLIAYVKGELEHSDAYYTRAEGVTQCTGTENERELIITKISSSIGKVKNLIFFGNKIEDEMLPMYFIYYICEKNSSEECINDRQIKLKLNSLSFLGVTCYLASNYNDALLRYSLQLKLATEQGDYLSQAEALAGIGCVYALKHEYEKALDKYYYALDVVNFFDSPNQKANILAGIGFVFYLQHEYRSSLFFYKQSLGIATQIDLSILKIEVLEKISIIQYKINISSFESTLIELEEILESFRRLKYCAGEVRVLTEVAQIYFESNLNNSIDRANTYCNEALKITQEKTIYAHLQEKCNLLSKEIDKALQQYPQSSPYSNMPTTTEVDLNDCPEIKDRVDIILIVATDIEMIAVRQKLQPYDSDLEGVLKIFEGTETYYVGKFGAFIAVVTKCRPGSSGIGASTSATGKAINLWKPKCIIMLGIAFGKDPKKYNIGDVLVASAIIPYESQRVGDIIIFRSPIPPSNPTLLNRFENVDGWEYRHKFNLKPGSILSGEKLIDDSDFKLQLFKQYPEAIGGEMEGAGLCAAAIENNMPWILVKSICDWADGNKNNPQKEEDQRLAANSAVSLVHHVLLQKTVLNGL